MGDRPCPNVVIWGDGDGSTFRATVDAIHDGVVDFQVRGVITANQNAGILDQVRSVNSAYGMDIEPIIIEGKRGKKLSLDAQDKVLEFLRRRDSPSLVLMGALVIMGELIIEELNGEVPEETLPKDIEGARKLMVPHDSHDTTHATLLPPSFPVVFQGEAGRFGLCNTHPAPTLVTANTWGIHAQRRMIDLYAAESAVTLHVVGKGVDSGPVLAAHKFPTKEVVGIDADELERDRAAGELFMRARRIEKAHLPLDVEVQLYNREAYLNKNA